jgi:hypothetical protein
MNLEPARLVLRPVNARGFTLQRQDVVGGLDTVFYSLPRGARFR